MNKLQKQIECVARLNQITSSSNDEIFSFLFAENLITKEEIRVIKTAPDQAKLIQAHLARISTDNKIQLLEYQWDFLPVERIKILIVTDRHSKEFSYNF